jgi:perosamine synthetase
MQAKKYIPVNVPMITEADAEAVSQCLRDGWISGEGPVVTEFESRIATMSNRKIGVAVANGTIAIDLAIELFDLNPEDEVILPSFTIVSCLSQIMRRGATPRFVDADPFTWNMDVNQLEEQINSKTKLIIAPHIYGLPIDMDPLLEIATQHGIAVLEDAAESHGLLYKDRVCGSFGDLSTFSFYANKNITTGEGGMLVTDNDEFAIRLKKLRNLNFRDGERFVSDELGWNYRISSLQAALGISQSSRLQEILQKRKEIGLFYQEAFKDIGDVRLPVTSSSYAENNYWVFGILLEGRHKGKGREIEATLDSRGVGTRPFFQPLHRQPVLKKYGHLKQGSLPISENLGESGFYIPNGLGTDWSDFELVAEIVSEVLT